MKKIVCCAVFALVLGGTLFSQTWTEEHTVLGMEIEAVCTKISKAEYDRLKRQYEATKSYCQIVYSDVSEWTEGGRVVKGQKPNLNGYYYITMKYDFSKYPLMEWSFAFYGMGMTLVYAHSQRGAIGLTYYDKDSETNTFPVNSTEYNRRVRQCTGFVEGR